MSEAWAVNSLWQAAKQFRTIQKLSIGNQPEIPELEAAGKVLDLFLAVAETEEEDRRFGQPHFGHDIEEDR